MRHLRAQAGPRGPCGPGRAALEAAAREGPRAPGAARGREPGGPGAPAPGHRAGNGSGAARARPARARLLRGVWRVRPGREAAGARAAPASGQRVLMAAPAPGTPGPPPRPSWTSWLGTSRTGRGAPATAPVGRVVPPEPGEAGRPAARWGPGWGRPPAGDDVPEDTGLPTWAELTRSFHTWTSLPGVRESGDPGQPPPGVGRTGRRFWASVSQTSHLSSLNPPSSLTDGL